MNTIYPITREWVETFVLDPYSKGAEWISEAWTPSDEFNQSALSIKTRIVYFLTGTALMVPLVNSVLWIFIKTFKNSTPQLPQLTHTPQTTPPSAPISVKKTDATGQKESAPKTPDFTYKETFDGKEAIINVNINVLADGIVRVQKSEHDYALYNADLTLKEFHFSGTDSEPKMDIIREGDKLKVTLGTAPQKSLDLDKAIPWIQEPMFGFRKFLASDEKEFIFYSVIESDVPSIGTAPFLMKVKAVKKSENLEILPVTEHLNWAARAAMWALGDTIKTDLGFKLSNTTAPNLTKYSAPKRKGIGFIKRVGELVPKSQ